MRGPLGSGVFGGGAGSRCSHLQCEVEGWSESAPGRVRSSIVEWPSTLSSLTSSVMWQSLEAVDRTVLGELHIGWLTTIHFLPQKGRSVSIRCTPRLDPIFEVDLIVKTITQTQESPSGPGLEDSSHEALQGYYVFRSSVMLAIGNQSLRGFDAAGWNPNFS